MSENLRIYQRCLFTMDGVVRLVPDDLWSAPTPCGRWTTAEVLGHVIETVERLVAQAGGDEPPAHRVESHIPGSHPGESWVSARDAVHAALDRPNLLGRQVTTAFGTFALDDVLLFAAIDILTHAWDLAVATGVDPRIPDDLAERFAADLASSGDSLRGPGQLGPPVAVDDSATTVERFIALSGRNPRWRSGLHLDDWSAS